MPGGAVAIVLRCMNHLMGFGGCRRKGEVAVDDALVLLWVIRIVAGRICDDDLVRDREEVVNGGLLMEA